MKLALPASPVVPVTVTVYEPFVPDATMNEPAIDPPATVQIGLVISPLGDDVIAQLVSLPAKFMPETRTDVPGLPAAGARLIVGISAKLAVALSFLGVPVALITKFPGARDGTVNEPDMLPTPVTAHDPVGIQDVGTSPIP